MISKSTFETLKGLWLQYLPLSISDVTMAFGDPAISTTVAQLPEPQSNLAALGIAKSIAVFFESPVIMLMHASNRLAGSPESRRALRRFMFILVSILGLILGFLTLKPIYERIAPDLFGIDSYLVEGSRRILLYLIAWPVFIGWRRFYQGLLIHENHANWIARAGILRLLSVCSILFWGFQNSVNGIDLAGSALIGGVLVEAIVVTWAAKYYRLSHATQTDHKDNLPKDIASVAKFYWPLAFSMLVIWGGRAILIAIIARAVDSELALAAWPTGWAIVLVIANATRMVQQVVIRNSSEVSERILSIFSVSVGLSLSFVLGVIAFAPFGKSVLSAFLGNHASLIEAVQPVIIITVFAPLLVSLQNMIQGFLMAKQSTKVINLASCFGTCILVISAWVAVLGGVPGALAAAAAMMIGLISELIFLFCSLKFLSRP